jgi:hypothetical protein
VNPLEGANCADLPGFVVEKYFECHSRYEPLKRMVALAICGNCDVLEACRTQALNTPTPPTRGVIAGMPATHMKTARAWRRYEQGDTEKPPRSPRPAWLPMTDATEAVERIRLEDDPDEPA